MHNINGLLPCPHCGSSLVTVFCDTNSDYKHLWTFNAECDDCDATGKSDLLEAKAIEAWNRRALDLRNLSGIERRSDMGVTLTFRSCRAASQFSAEIEALAAPVASGGHKIMNTLIINGNADQIAAPVADLHAAPTPWNERMGVKVGDMIEPASAFNHMKAEILDWRARHAAAELVASPATEQAGGMSRYDLILGCMVEKPQGAFLRHAELVASKAPSVELMRQAVATVVSRTGNDLRVGWLRPERCDVGTLLYCATITPKESDNGN